jgi:hypothetical protein
MNSLANEMTARAIVTHRLQRAETRRAAALAGSELAQHSRRWATLRMTLGTSIESLGRRVAGSPEPAAGRGC